MSEHFLKFYLALFRESKWWHQQKKNNNSIIIMCAASWPIVTRFRILTFLKRELGSGVIAALFSFVNGVCRVLSDRRCVNMVLNIIPLISRLLVREHAEVVFFFKRKLN